jgi:hypothetical protein
VTSRNSTRGAFEPLAPAAQLAFVAGPILVLGLILLTTWSLVSGEAAGFVASMAAGAFVGGGKLVILAGAVDTAPVGTWGLAALIVYMEVATALVVIGGLHLLYDVPGVGPRLASARESGWRLLQRHPWTRQATWASLAGFVAVPFNGTGAFVGAFLGRMLGLSRFAILTATACGSLAGSVSMALSGDLWAERINALAERPVPALIAVVTLAALAILTSKWMFGVRTDTNDSDGRRG